MQDYHGQNHHQRNAKPVQLQAEHLTVIVGRERQLCQGKSREALDLNRDLDNIKAQIIKHYQYLSDREAFVTAEMVRNAYQGFGSEYETLLGAFDKDIANLKRHVGKDRALGTYYVTVYNMEVVLLLAFRLNSYQASNVRQG